MTAQMQPYAKDGGGPVRENNYAREFVGVLFQRRRLILSVFLGFALLTVLVVLFAPSVYIANSQLVVLSKKVIQNAQAGSAPAEFLPPAPEDLQTEISILLSPTLMRETVAELRAEGLLKPEDRPARAGAGNQNVAGLSAFFDAAGRRAEQARSWLGKAINDALQSISPDDAGAPTDAQIRSSAKSDPVIDRIATTALEDLGAEIEPGSNVVALSYKNEDAYTSTTLLNRLVKNYLQSRQKILLNEGSSRYFTHKKGVYRQRLEKLARSKLLTLRRGGTTNPKVESRQLLTMMSRETRRLYRLRDVLASEQKWLNYVRARMRGIDSPAELASFSLPEQLQRRELTTQQERVARINQAYVRASQVYVAGSRRIVALSRRLDVERQRLSDLIDNRVAEREARARVFTAAVRDARERIQTLRTRAQTLKRVGTQVRQVDTEIQVVRQAYLNYSRQLERARAEESTDAGQISNVQVLNWATLPLKPDFPNAKAMLPIGLAAGLLLGLMVAYLREYFDHTFRRPDQIHAHLGIPVIASIVRVKRGASRAGRSRNAVQPGENRCERWHVQAHESPQFVRLRSEDAHPAIAVRRVLHLVSPAGLYGGERVLLNQMQIMPRMEFAVAYFHKGTSGQDDFLNAVRDRTSQVTAIENRLTRLPRALREIRRAIQSSRADVLHCHSYKATVLGTLAARRLGVPVVVTQHGIIERSRKSRLYYFLDRAACRFLRVDRVICVSSDVYDRYAEFGVSKARLHLLPNATRVPGQLDEHDDKHKRALARFAPGESRRFVLYVGRLSDEKGPDLFLDMIARLRESDPSVLGIVIGDGPMRIPLLNRAKTLGLYNHIRFTGFLEDASRLIAYADLIVIPSRSEGIPMVLLEAMAAGTPVVATAVGGIRQVLRNDETGLIVAPDDSSALADAVAALLASAQQRERLRRGAWAFVRDHHDLQRQAEALGALYADAAANHDSARFESALKQPA